MTQPGDTLDQTPLAAHVLELAATFGRPSGPFLSARPAATATNSSDRTGTRVQGAR